MLKPYFAIVCLAGLLAACSEELPPRSVEHFMRESASLQATLLRCRESGFEAQNVVECANARAAAERLGEQEAEARRAEREAAFERKRELLRRREREARRASGWPEEEEVEPPLGAAPEPPIGEDPYAAAPTDAGSPPDIEEPLSEAEIEAEIRRLQDLLDQRQPPPEPEASATDEPALPLESEARVTEEPAPPPASETGAAGETAPPQ